LSGIGMLFLLPSVSACEQYNCYGVTTCMDVKANIGGSTTSNSYGGGSYSGMVAGAGCISGDWVTVIFQSSNDKYTSYQQYIGTPSSYTFPVGDAGSYTSAGTTNNACDGNAVGVADYLVGGCGFRPHYVTPSPLTAFEGSILSLVHVSLSQLGNQFSLTAANFLSYLANAKG
jgi:hypothetical protein